MQTEALPVAPRHEGDLPLGKQRIRRALRREYAESGELARVERFRNLHAGERCFIVGNGPSLATQDLRPLTDEVTFVTNWFANHELAGIWRPTYYCIASHEVFGGWGTPDPTLNADLARLLSKRMSGVTKFFSFRFSHTLWRSGLFSPRELRFLLFDRPKLQIDERGTMNLDPAHQLDDGYTVVITFAIFLARLMGFKEIYLLGCDCDYGIAKPTDTKQYFYDSSLHTTSTSKFESLQRIWAEDGPIFRTYAIVRDVIQTEGLTIRNATRGGRLEAFPRVTYEDVIA